MTIAKTINRVQYAGDDASTAFAYGYRFYADTDLEVYLLDAAGVETLQTLTTHYTVANNGDETGGTVTMVTPPATGETLTILGAIPSTQSTDYVSNDAFPAETHETGLDRLTRVTQQISEKMDRGAFIRASTALSGLTLPEPVEGYFLTGNTAGNGWINGTSAAEILASASVSDVGFATRSALVTWLASNTPSVGTIMHDGTVSYKASSGATDISDMAGVLPYGPVRPEHFGENVTPGTTDMTTAAQAAIDYLETLSGGTLKLRGKYYFGSTITVNGSNITVDASGSDITCAATMGAEVQNKPDGIFNVIGTEAALANLAADAAENAETVTVDSATGMAVGQTIYFYNAVSGVGHHWYTEGGTAIFRSHINRIKDISGTTITLMHPLPMGLDDTTYTCVVRTWTGVENFHIIGGKWHGGGYDHALANGKGNALLFAQYAQNVSVRAESVSGFSGAAVWCEKVYAPKVIGGDYQGHDDSYTSAIVEGTNSGFYGVRFDECRSGIIDGITGRRLRHLSDGTRSENVIVSSCHAVNSHRVPFGSHSGCNNWMHRDLSSVGPNGGVLWRGFDCQVHGLVLNAPNDSEPAFYDTTGAAADLYRNYQISGFETKTGREAIRLEANIDGCIINGGEMEGAIESTAYNVILLNTPYLNTFQMNGGFLKGATARLVDMGASPTTRAVVQFNGTEFRDHTTNAVRCYAVSGATSLLVKDCYFVPNGATTHVDAQGTYENLSRNGWVQGGAYYHPDNQGTWTPALGDASNDCTHSTQVATWRRDGDRVHISGRVTITGLGSVAGSLLIKGLPFNIKTGTYAGGTVTYATGLTLPAAASITLRALSGGTDMNLFVWEATAGPNTMVVTDISATTTMYFEATYSTDD